MKYIGTKTVNAVPMTAEVATEKGYKVNNHTGDGYEVEYEDGYKSWSPKEVFDKAYMPAETPKDRAIIEASELAYKICKLKTFIPENVDRLQLDLMRRQEVEMEAYLLTLRARIELM